MQKCNIANAVHQFSSVSANVGNLSVVKSIYIYDIYIRKTDCTNLLTVIHEALPELLKKFG